MRPPRFRTFLQQLLATAPGVIQVQTTEDVGYDRHRGLVVTYATGARVVLQAVATARTDDDYAEPEKITEGNAPLPEVPMSEPISDGRLRLSAVDEQLAAVVTNSGSREVQEVEVYSRRPEPGAVRYGCTIRFHDSAKIFLYVVEAVPQGRDPRPERAFKDVPAAV